jgi:DNA-directed RNA polymerase II subunit RPB2
MKIGEMEKDCLFVHGASATLSEKMYDNSDNFDIVYCKQCGYRADSDLKI